ncbi:MAG: hypothetical protein ABWY02_02515 [Telluria sp.]
MSGTTHVLRHASDVGIEAHRSGVSWGAIIAGAGAAAAAALSIVLYLLGSGLGFSSMSPYEDNSAVAMGIGAILWLSFTQLAASALGGWRAALRSKPAWIRPPQGSASTTSLTVARPRPTKPGQLPGTQLTRHARLPPVRHCG